ncbi:hypothetical protein ASZ90_017272 [hydrocarbon metagenome]|uniref:Manganese efflux pump MntP n=1 Tax=hydrocarbon metagenome TaxID=938273 RepID=A0A0W8E9H9_9ZZZZ
MSGHLLTILLVAIVLGMDAFSLALVMGLRGTTRNYEYKFAAAVGMFHILMPLIGLSLGYTAGKLLGLWASWLGAAVLAYVGITFIMEGYREVKRHSAVFDQARQLVAAHGAGTEYGEKNILLLTASVSVDALATGFTLGTTQVPILHAVIIIGITAGVMTMIGFRSGKILGSLVGRYAQIAGGFVLIMLAVKILM